MKYLNLLAKDKNLIIYRPEFRKITGSITSAILLHQIIFWWAKNDKRKFYKFKEKCNHEKYKEGDSWCEELGFSRKEFDTAIKKIGYKLSKAKNANVIGKDKDNNPIKKKKEDAFVIYYRDREGLTWYELQEELLENKLIELYMVKYKRDFSNETTDLDFSNVEYEKDFSNNEYKDYNKDYNKDKKENNKKKSSVSMFKDKTILYDYNGTEPIYKPIDEVESKDRTLILEIMNYVKTQLPTVATMKRPIAYMELQKLLAKFNSDSIILKLQAMENIPNLKRKYKTTYFTLNNWLNR